MKDKTHRQRIEEEMAIKNPDFDLFTKLSFAVCAGFGFAGWLFIIVIVATVFNILS